MSAIVVVECLWLFPLELWSSFISTVVSQSYGLSLVVTIGILDLLHVSCCLL